MSGKKSRDKGARFEREVVNFHKELGLDAERVPLSGALKGSYAGDVRIEAFIAECKRRANGFNQLYGWIEHDNADLLVIRSDNKPRMYVLTEETWLALLKQGGMI